MRSDFERITPEEAGIPSSEILAYMKELTGARLCLHDLLLFRNGKLVYEVEFKSSGMEYDYEIDAATGTILKQEAERDD